VTVADGCGFRESASSIVRIPRQPLWKPLQTFAIEQTNCALTSDTVDEVLASGTNCMTLASLLRTRLAPETCSTIFQTS
jgi:hypothetical protein